MLSRENHTYDCHYVTKENQPFEFQCGHTATTSITTIIDFNNSDELNRWNTNKAKGNCPRCEKIEEFKLQQEKIKAEKDDCYFEMECRHQILVDSAYGAISDRTYELRRLIDNKKYPSIHSKVIQLMEKINGYENNTEYMDSTFEFYKNNFDMKQCFDILQEHIASTQHNLTLIHSQLIYIFRAIYENPSHLSDLERNFIYHKANLVLISIEAEYKRQDVYKELQKQLSEKVIHFTQDNIDKIN